MIYLFLATYGTVFLSEIVGDKSVYTISSLTMRFNSLQVFCGITLAFMAKMLAAILIGQAIGKLPAAIVAGTSAATFFATAFVIWYEKPEGKLMKRENSQSWSRAVPISFAAIFFSEWGDPGQIAAAVLAATYRLQLIVWLAATLALVTKGLLAIALGVGLRMRLPLYALRYAALFMCLLMGVLSIVRLI